MRKEWLPWAMVAFRLVLGPILLADAWDGHTDMWFVAGLGAAILSDILDGIVARSLGTASQRLRRADSLVDGIFSLFVMASAWLAQREVILAHGALVAAMLTLSLLSQIPALLKFGRAAAFHAYSAKASGLAFLAAGTALFGFGVGGWLLDFALWVSILSSLERIAITFLLPEWRTDVNGVWVAWRIRNEAGY